MKVTNFSAVNSSPPEYSQFITIFGAQLTNEHALQLEQFLPQHINHYYLCAYQPEELSGRFGHSVAFDLELDKAAVKQFAQAVALKLRCYSHHNWVNQLAGDGYGPAARN